MAEVPMNLDKLRRSLSGRVPVELAPQVDVLRLVLGSVIRAAAKHGAEPVGVLEVYPHITLTGDTCWVFVIDESAMPPPPPPRVVTWKNGEPAGDRPFTEVVYLDDTMIRCPCGATLSDKGHWTNDPRETWFHDHYAHSNGYIHGRYDAASALRVWTSVPPEYTREIT